MPQVIFPLPPEPIFLPPPKPILFSLICLPLGLLLLEFEAFLVSFPVSLFSLNLSLDLVLFLLFSVKSIADLIITAGAKSTSHFAQLGLLGKGKAMSV